MTPLICPLYRCFVSLTHFDMDRRADIFTVEVTGLGCGRSVKVTRTYSIIASGEPIIEQIN